MIGGDFSNCRPQLQQQQQQRPLTNFVDRARAEDPAVDNIRWKKKPGICFGWNILYVLLSYEGNLLTNCDVCAVIFFWNELEATGLVLICQEVNKVVFLVQATTFNNNLTVIKIRMFDKSFFRAINNYVLAFIIQNNQYTYNHRHFLL